MDIGIPSCRALLTALYLYIRYFGKLPQKSGKINEWRKKCGEYYVLKTFLFQENNQRKATTTVRTKNWSDWDIDIKSFRLYPKYKNML